MRAAVLVAVAVAVIVVAVFEWREHRAEQRRQVPPAPRLRVVDPPELTPPSASRGPYNAAEHRCPDVVARRRQRGQRQPAP